MKVVACGTIQKNNPRTKRKSGIRRQLSAKNHARRECKLNSVRFVLDCFQSKSYFSLDPIVKAFLIRLQVLSRAAEHAKPLDIPLTGSEIDLPLLFKIGFYRLIFNRPPNLMHNCWMVSPQFCRGCVHFLEMFCTAR